MASVCRATKKMKNNSHRELIYMNVEHCKDYSESSYSDENVGTYSKGSKMFCFAGIAKPWRL